MGSSVTGSHPSARDPLTVAVSKDGTSFETALVAITCTDLDEMTKCLPRFPGKSKNPGPSYPQAIAVVDPAPSSLVGFYVGASVNKEDIWVVKMAYADI